MKHLPKIVIDVIPHKKQRYDTCGDYFEKKGETHIRVSQMSANHEFLVLLHELIEWYLIKQEGISIKEIDEFDIEFAANKSKGEPGDDLSAPYYDEHQFATIIEQLMARKLGVDWKKYDDHVKSL